MLNYDRFIVFFGGFFVVFYKQSKSGMKHERSNVADTTVKAHFLFYVYFLLPDEVRGHSVIRIWHAYHVDVFNLFSHRKSGEHVT